jgi:cold shock CspA family protein
MVGRSRKKRALSLTGTITQLRRDRGTGSLLAEDGKAYSFRRSDVRNVWFHDLTEGATVTFEVEQKSGEFQATLVRPVHPSK